MFAGEATLSLATSSRWGGSALLELRVALCPITFAGLATQGKGVSSSLKGRFVRCDREDAHDESFVNHPPSPKDTYAFGFGMEGPAHRGFVLAQIAVNDRIDWIETEKKPE